MSISVCDGSSQSALTRLITTAFGADAKEAFLGTTGRNSDGIRGMSAGSTRKIMVQRHSHPGRYR